MRMTTQEAKQILKEGGYHYLNRADLYRFRARAFDPIIKNACDKLLSTGRAQIFGRAREPLPLAVLLHNIEHARE